jgi:hypothetical protein
MNPCISKMSFTYVHSGVSSFLPLYVCIWVCVRACVCLSVCVLACWFIPTASFDHRLCLCSTEHPLPRALLRSLSLSRARPRARSLHFALPHSPPHSLLLAHSHDGANFPSLCLLLVAVLRVSFCTVRDKCGMLRAGEQLREGFRVHPIPDSGC